MYEPLYIAIDPGKKGAHCAFVPDLGKFYFIDNKESPYKILNWIKILRIKYELIFVTIEEVNSIPGSSAKANFSFGGEVIGARKLIQSIKIEPCFVAPKKWQEFIGLSTPKGLKGKERKEYIKKTICEIAINLYPQCEEHFFNKNGTLLDGRSDASMIAHYSYKTDKQIHTNGNTN